MKKLIFAAIFFGLGIFTYLIFEQTFPRNMISAYVSTFEINTDIVLEDINSYRQENGIKALIKNDKLCLVAKTRLEETSINWSHEGFKAARFCAVNCIMGENLAKAYKAEQDIVDAWKGSSEHKAVMLNRDVKYGCVASNGHYTVLSTSSMIPY